MARSDAWRMLIRSISSGVAWATAKEIAASTINEKALSRAAGDRAFESRTAGSENPGGRTTAAATTGPASGPRPASSTPATVRYPLARARASKPSTAVLGRLLFGFRGRGGFRRGRGGIVERPLGGPLRGDCNA